MLIRRTQRALVVFLSLAVVATIAIAASAGKRPGGWQGHTQSHQPQAPAWWQDNALRSRLGLTQEQTDRINGLFKTYVEDTGGIFEELSRAEADLKTVLDKEGADDSVVLAKIDDVEHLRYQINTRRFFMLYRMDRALTPGQRTVLRQWAEQRIKKR
jgi:Spy/CpxP family protein refolding chaperone